MKGMCIAIASFMTVVFLSVHAFPASAEDVRGPSGLPTYLRSPSDRPPPVGVEPGIVPPHLSTDGFLATVPPNDSVIIINGKVDLRGKSYFSAYPKFRGGSLFDGMKACRMEYRMRPQYKAREGEGYTMFVVVKETATNPDCWSQLRNLKTVELSCDRIMVKPSEKDEPVAWDNPDSSYTNSYDLRTLDIGPVLPR
jgi:hypothetical protein